MKFARLIDIKNTKGAKSFFVLISLLFWVIFLLTLMINPAPVKIGILEVTILLCVLLLLGITAAFILQTKALVILDKLQIKIGIYFFLYLLMFIVSSLIGSFKGASGLTLIRSVAPYVAFIPLLLAGILIPGFIGFKKINLILFNLGILQVIYLLYLYFFSTKIVNYSKVEEVLINRITLLDLRTLYPFFMFLIIISMANLFAKKPFFTRFFWLCLLLITIFASLTTQTRAQFLTIVLGCSIYIYLHMKYNINIFKEKKKAYSQIIISFIFLIITLIILYKLIPQFRVLLNVLIFRSRSLDNGRIFEEWIPALKTFSDGNLVQYIFGIGAGVPFITSTGEPRTYIHNILLYFLVYNGIFGLLLILLIYYTLFYTLIAKAIEVNNSCYLIYAGLLFMLFVYAQFFAIHKSLPYNAIFFAIAYIAVTARD